MKFLLSATVVLSFSCTVFGAGIPAVQPLELNFGPIATLYEGGVFPYMFLAKDGTTVVHGVKGWRKESVEGIPFTVRSTDDRQTWKVWNPSPDQQPGPTHEGSVVQLKDGSILIFNWSLDNLGVGRFKGKLWESTNQWETLAGPREIQLSIPRAAPPGFDDRGEPFGGVVFHRSVLELPGGDLLAGLYGRFEEDTTPTEYQAKQHKYRSFVMRSSDRGKRWSYISTIASGPVEQEGYCEPVLLRLSQVKHRGRLICLMRTGRENPIYQCESDDEGATWNQPRALRWAYSKYGRSREIAGTDPDLIEMSDGTLAFSFGHKPDYRDDGNFLAFSLDQGQSWTQVTRVSSARTCAYTTVREIRPGVLFIVYSLSKKGSDDARYEDDFKTVGQTITVSRRPAALN